MYYIILNLYDKSNLKKRQKTNKLNCSYGIIIKPKQLKVTRYLINQLVGITVC